MRLFSCLYIAENKKRLFYRFFGSELYIYIIIYIHDTNFKHFIVMNLREF